MVPAAPVVPAAPTSPDHIKQLLSSSLLFSPATVTLPAQPAVPKGYVSTNGSNSSTANGNANANGSGSGSPVRTTNNGIMSMPLHDLSEDEEMVEVFEDDPDRPGQQRRMSISRRSLASHSRTHSRTASRAGSSRPSPSVSNSGAAGPGVAANGLPQAQPRDFQAVATAIATANASNHGRVTAPVVPSTSSSSANGYDSKLLKTSDSDLGHPQEPNAPGSGGGGKAAAAHAGPRRSGSNGQVMLLRSPSDDAPRCSFSEMLRPGGEPQLSQASAHAQANGGVPVAPGLPPAPVVSLNPQPSATATISLMPGGGDASSSRAMSVANSSAGGATSGGSGNRLHHARGIYGSGNNLSPEALMAIRSSTTSACSEPPQEAIDLAAALSRASDTALNRHVLEEDDHDAELMMQQLSIATGLGSPSQSGKPMNEAQRLLAAEDEEVRKHHVG